MVGVDNFVAKNTSSGNLNGDYLIQPDNHFGQIVTDPGMSFVSTHPWANYSY